MQFRKVDSAKYQYDNTVQVDAFEHQGKVYRIATAYDPKYAYLALMTGLGKPIDGDPEELRKPYATWLEIDDELVTADPYPVQRSATEQKARKTHRDLIAKIKNTLMEKSNENTYHGE